MRRNRHGSPYNKRSDQVFIGRKVDWQSLYSIAHTLIREAVTIIPQHAGNQGQGKSAGILADELVQCAHESGFIDEPDPALLKLSVERHLSARGLQYQRRFLGTQDGSGDGREFQL